MAITQEIYDSLPEEAKSAFAESDEGYIPVKDAALKATLDNVDKEKRALQGKVEALTKSEQETQAKIEQARVEAREEAILEAQKKGNWEEQERLLREKFEDELKRNSDSVRGEVEREFTLKLANESLDSDAKLLAKTMAKSPELEPTLEVILKTRMGLDDAAKRFYKDSEGRALSIDGIESYKSEIAKDPTVMALIKGETNVNGGGLANGGGKLSGAKPTNAKAEEAKKNGDLVGFLNAKINR